MKHIFVFLIAFIFLTSAIAQTIGSKVSLTAVDGKPYTGTGAFQIVAVIIVNLVN